MPNSDNRKLRKRSLILILLMAFLICSVLSSCQVKISNGESVNVFNYLLVRPFAWILLEMYLWVQSFGLALILFTLFTRIVLLPLNIKSKRNMQDIQRIQPMIKELDAKYKNDKQKYQEETAKLYKKEGVSPLGGCLPMLITLPIMFALYWPISQPLKYLMRLTTDQISAISAKLIEIGATVSGTAITARSSEMALAQAINENFDAVKGISDHIMQLNLNFLGMNLGSTPSLRVMNVIFFLPIISAVSAFLLSKITTWLQERSTGVITDQSNKTMLWMMPIISLWMGFTLPAGLSLYWVACNLVGMGQEFLIDWILRIRKKSPSKEAASKNGQNSRNNGKNKR